MAIAVAVVAGVSGWAAGGAAATIIGGGFAGVLGGVVAGAVVGGAVGAAGYAVIGEDPMDGLKAGAISGGLSGGLAGWGGMGDGGMGDGGMGDGGTSGATDSFATSAVEPGTGNIASSAIEAGTGKIAGSGALATGNIGSSSGGLMAQTAAPQISSSGAGVGSIVTTPNPDSGGFLKNMFSGGSSEGGEFSSLLGGGEPMSDTMKAATVMGGMQLGGSMISGYAQEKAAEEQRKHMEKLREERRARINNLTPETLMKYGSLYKSKYI